MARKPSKKKLKQLIETYGGIKTDIAKACNVSRQSVHNWINSDEDLKQMVENMKDELVDLAKKGLKHHLEQQSEKTIHWTLERLARQDGFGKVVQVKDTTNFQDALNEMTDEELMNLLTKTNEKLNG